MDFPQTIPKLPQNDQNLRQPPGGFAPRLGDAIGGTVSLINSFELLNLDDLESGWSLSVLKPVNGKPMLINSACLQISGKEVCVLGGDEAIYFNMKNSMRKMILKWGIRRLIKIFI